MLKQLAYLAIAAVAAFIGAATVSFAQSQTTPVIDHSRSYGMQGLPRMVDPPQGRERTIIDLNPQINISGVLGCAGLEIDAMMRDVLGVGNVDMSELADQMMQNLQTQFAQEMLTQLMSDPTIASIQQQISALANARLTMIKAECNAIQAREQGVSAMIRAEAQRRCFEKHGLNDTRCEDGTFLREAVEEIVEEPRWNKTFREQICDREIEQCDWTQLLPDFKPDLSGPSAAPGEGGGTPPDDGNGGNNADTDPKNKEVTPPVFTLFDAKDVALETASSLISQNANAARAAVQNYGYSRALRLANDQHDDADDAAPPSVPEDGKDTSTALPVSINQIMSAHGCAEFSIVGAGGFESNPLEETSGERSLGISPPTPTHLPSSVPVTPREPASGLFPLLWPSQGPVTSPGPSMRIHPIRGTKKMHNGTDIGIPTGSAVLAPASGRYIHRGYEPRGAGTYSWLVAGGYTFKFFHLDSHVAPSNSQVSRGQLIARSGNTGGSTGPHLHFEIWNAAGKPLHPKNLDIDGYGDSNVDNAIYNPDSHGDIDLVSNAVSNFDPNDPYIKAMEEDIQKLGIRITQAASCLVNNNIDPHVYVQMGVLPDVMYESMIDALSSSLSHQAVLAVMNSTILQFSLSLARKSSDGEKAMNPATKEFAIKQLDLLKNIRDALQSDFDMKNEVSSRIQEMNDYVEEAQRRMRRGR